MEYKPTIGLEIHAELKTKIRKQLCACKNDAHEKDPQKIFVLFVGVIRAPLPVINKEAVKSVLKKRGWQLVASWLDFTELDPQKLFFIPIFQRVIK